MQQSGLEMIVQSSVISFTQQSVRDSIKCKTREVSGLHASFTTMKGNWYAQVRTALFTGLSIMCTELRFHSAQSCVVRLHKAHVNLLTVCCAASTVLHRLMHWVAVLPRQKQPPGTAAWAV